MSDASRSSQYVMPDFIIQNNDGELELTLSSRNAPELHISKAYTEMLRAYSDNKKDKSNKDALMFVKQKSTPQSGLLML